MSDTLIYRDTPPALLPLFGKAVLPKKVSAEANIRLPELSAKLLYAKTSSNDLKQYERVCGFRPSSDIPITWPHILAFPLHLKLLTEKAFPLPLLGLVHLRNSITQHRPIGKGEILELEVKLGGQERTGRGIEFSVNTIARSAGTMVWEGDSTMLFRQPDPNAQSGEKSTPPPLEHYPNTVDIKAAESIGRQYAKVSGDSNPIHMHALSAKAFGFPRAIAHGMWSKAQALAIMSQQDGWRSGPVKISCQFKKPVFLPGTAQLNWREGKDAWDYQLLNGRGDAPHLSGRIEWL
ncbi:MaoC/PaaZ C-terminal domain-containing protein [Marinobacter salexigens]|uniref:MaoC/PaaZ C-terminal domain-containing protein n=1 Tax=Marinobacter salexigens TaxID=1925763 RepID=UPI000C295735|nr:MaoC/PaaZ C-terminal domain-containing protein [Marinobacter salexigens]